MSGSRISAMRRCRDCPPHGLRRTFASLLYGIGESSPVVMAELGHTDPRLALSIYAHAMRRDEGDHERLRELVEGAPLQPTPSDRRVEVRSG